jgi:hypothetical protein
MVLAATRWSRYPCTRVILWRLYNGIQRLLQPTGELGYQFLDTRFTGASSARLSGGNGLVWTFNAADQGVAQILSAFEITGNIPQVEVKFEKSAVEAGTRRLGARWSVELRTRP